MLGVLVCGLIVGGWYYIHEAYFKHRFVSNKKTDYDDDKKSDKSQQFSPSLNATSTSIQQVVELTSLANRHYDSRLSMEPAKSTKYRRDDTGLELEGDGSDNDLSPSVQPQQTEQNETISHYDHNNKLFSENSSIASIEQFNLITKWLPPAQQNRAWNLRYSLRRDGASLETLISLCALTDRFGQVSQTSNVIIIEDSWGYIFGGYLGHSFEHKSVNFSNFSLLV